MELGLRLSLGFSRADNLDCWPHRCDGKRNAVRADEKVTAFLELEASLGEFC
jgi:hypothetical protein